MKRIIFMSLASAAMLAACGQARLDIDASAVECEIPSLIYGAGAEDVNHEIYGGLYDQRIFGESMEEPSTAAVDGFMQYDSPWTVSGDVLELHTGGHGKIVCLEPYMERGSVSVDVSLDAAKGKVVVGRHRHNWAPIAEVPAEFPSRGWNTLRVDFDGGRFTTYVNGKKVHACTDRNAPIVGGRVGLRTFDGPASFRSLSIDGGEVALETAPRMCCACSRP